MFSLHSLPLVPKCKRWIGFDLIIYNSAVNDVSICQTVEKLLNTVSWTEMRKSYLQGSALHPQDLSVPLYSAFVSNVVFKRWCRSVAGLWTKTRRKARSSKHSRQIRLQIGVLSLFQRCQETSVRRQHCTHLLLFHFPPIFFSSPLCSYHPVPAEGALWTDFFFVGGGFHPCNGTHHQKMFTLTKGKITHF